MPSYVSKGKLHRIDNDFWEQLNRLSEAEVDKLADLMGVGFLNHPEDIDREDKILVLSTEPITHIRSGLKKLRLLKTG